MSGSAGSKRGGIAQNPLAVISILIGVVEAAFSYPVTRLSGLNQTICVIFMVVFPVLLMMCFFATVWFKPGHLYAPKDYASTITTTLEADTHGSGKVPHE